MLDRNRDSANSKNSKQDSASSGSLPPSPASFHGDELVSNHLRLQALKRTRLMNSPREEAFDRLAELGARVLKVPLTIASLIGETKQFFKAAHGLPHPYDRSREIPIDGSICRHTLHGESIVIEDAAAHPLFKDRLSALPWKMGAFISLPIFSTDGQVLGAFSAFDTKKRSWTPDDIANMKDLTASIMTEIKLRTQVADLELERDLREQFVTTLTHDLRTPLGVAKMAADILQTEDGDDFEREKLATMIINNMNRADQMIQDLLDASRIKAGEKIAIDPKECNLVDIVNAASDTLTVLHGDRFKLEHESGGNLDGIWDPMAIQRMIENLGSNAVKYGNHDKPITLKSALCRADDGSLNAVEISVHNWGTPIAPENLQNLFEPYQRSESAVRGKQKGWGIGLTLVRGFADAHGGTIQAQSSTTDGTCFTLRLPRQAPATS